MTRLAVWLNTGNNTLKVLSVWAVLSLLALGLFAGTSPEGML